MRRRPVLRRVLIGSTLVAALLLVLSTTAALGVDFLNGKLRGGDSITVPASETVNHDLYVFAGTVTVDGTVNGDLVVAGGTVRVSGPVSGDLLVAGGTVQLAGKVTGDVRVAGGQVTITGSVGKDLAAGVGTLDVSGSVAGDLMFGAGTATIPGPVAGSIVGSAGTYSRSGSLGGSEDVTINPRASSSFPQPNPVLDAIRQFIVVFLIGALALWLLPRAVEASETTLERQTLLSVAGGVLAILGYIVAVFAIILVMILLAIVFGVLTLGAVVAIDIFVGFVALMAVTLAFVVSVAFLGDVVVGLALGRMLAPALGLDGRRMVGVPPGAPGARPPAADRWRDLGILAIGAALVVIVSSLPEVGGVAKLIVVILGVGAIALAAWNARRGRRPALEPGGYPGSGYPPGAYGPPPGGPPAYPTMPPPAGPPPAAPGGQEPPTG